VFVCGRRREKTDMKDDRQRKKNQGPSGRRSEVGLSKKVGFPSPLGGAGSRGCTKCKATLPKALFTPSQWQKGAAAKCKGCTKEQNPLPPPPLNNNATASSTNTATRTPTAPSSSFSSSTLPAVLGSLSMSARPQREVPGFPGLLCCADWPQTKGGKPPIAQSAIFNPLLACVLGPIEGHCTEQQLDFAENWWKEALPAWPRWVAELRAAGVPALKHRLLTVAKGNPNPLIPKAGKGAGTVPHFRGRDQNEALEMGGMVSVEVYAAITCMYSSAALEEAENESEK
jgi:hypothetical protein